MIKRVSIKAASCLDMISAFKSQIADLDPSYVGAGSNCGDCEEPVEAGRNCKDCEEPVEAGMEIDPAQEPVMGAGEVDEAYVDEMMQYVADETASMDSPATCSWSVEGEDLVFILTGLDSESVEEYTCPLTDLTGDIDTDINYVCESIGI